MDAATLTPNLGDLYQGQDVLLICSTTLRITDMGGVMHWFYNGVRLTTLGFSTTDPINTTREARVSGFMSLVLTSRMPEFASTLSFRADAAMNGGIVSCGVIVTLSGGGIDTQEPSQILRTIAGKCCDSVENTYSSYHSSYGEKRSSS